MRKKKRNTIDNNSGTDEKKEPGSPAPAEKSSVAGDNGRPRQTPSEHHGKKPLWKRIAKQSLKTIFIRLPLALVIIIMILMVFLKVFLTPSRVESLITDNFNSQSNGKISLKVKEFSPYGGFVMEDIAIHNGPEFDNSLFVSVKRVAVKYHFFRFFTGSFRIPEIGVYNPRIYLTEKKGLWNTARLMKESEKKPEDKKPEIEEDSEPGSDHISLPLSVDLVFRFALEDLCLYARSADFRSSLENFSFRSEVIVPPVKRIPLSLKAVTLLKTMEMELNPGGELNLSFYSKEAEVTPPLILGWKLSYMKGDGSAPRFNSSFRFGTNRTPVRFRGNMLAPLSFLVSYNVFYNPLQDSLSLDNFGVTFGGKKWIDLTGTVSSLTKSQIMDIRMRESDIDLNRLHPYYVSVTRDHNTRFNGSISLFPLTVRGSGGNYDLDGSLTLKNIYLKLIREGVEANLPLMTLGYGVKVRGGDVRAVTDLKMPHLFYALKGSRSGDNGLHLSADIQTADSGKRIIINNTSLRYYYPPSGAAACSMAMKGSLNTAAGLSGQMGIDSLVLDLAPLKLMLPGRIAQELKSAPLKKPVTLSMSSDFNLGGSMTRAALLLTARIPDFELNDLKMEAGIRQDAKNQRLYLDGFSLGSAAWNAGITASGRVEMKRAPFSDSDLKLSAKFDARKKRRIMGEMDIEGLLDISASMKGDLESGSAAGAVRMEGLSVNSREKLLSLKNLNLNFPFRYGFRKKPAGESLLTVRKNQIIENPHFQDKPNFTIASISARHPARKISVEYLKDFQSYIAFKDNLFEISGLRAYILDGSLYGRRILFSIADLNTHNMEYLLELDATNIDIDRLDRPDLKEKTRRAELSFNANIAGRDLDIGRQLNMDGYVNIHKIGTDFANSLMKGLSEKKGKSILGIAQPVLDNSMTIREFNFDILNGLIYSKVSLNRRLLGNLFRIKDDTIEFERIPIQEYLRKVRKGESNEIN